MHSVLVDGEIQLMDDAQLAAWIATLQRPAICRDGVNQVMDDATYAQFQADQAAIPAFLLGRARNGKQAALDHAYAVQQATPRSVTIGGAAHLFSVTTLAQQKITSLGLKATTVAAGLGGLSWEDGFSYPAADGTAVAMSAADFIAFADTLERVYVRPMDMNYAAKAKAVAVATDQAALDAIDVTAGWPS